MLRSIWDPREVAFQGGSPVNREEAAFEQLSEHVVC